MCDDTQSRFFEAVFDSVLVTKDVQYSRMPDYKGDTVDLVLDIYEPYGDTASQRPAMLICHGGGFIQGSKTDGSIKPFLYEMAKRGYVIISTNYRLDDQQNIIAQALQGDVEDEVYKAFFRATQDGRAAYRYMKKTVAEDANPYRIDTSMYYFAGGSAGGILTLYAVFADLDEWKNSASLSDTTIFTQLGGLDASGYGQYEVEPFGVFQIAGAIGDTSFIDRNDIPLISQHGTEDLIVSYGDGGYTIPGIVDVPLQGSQLVHQRLQNLGGNSVLQSWKGQGHVPWASGGEGYYLDTSLAHVVSHSYALTCDVPPPDYVYFYPPDVETGVPEQMPHAELNVYPNPARERVMLASPELHPGTYELRLVDMNGRLVAQRTLRVSGSTLTIERGNWTAGLYHLLLRSDTRFLHGKVLFEQR